MLALSARTQDAYQRSLQSFEELVRNYTFISDHPKDEIDHFDLILVIADDQSHTALGKEYDNACGIYFAQQHAKSIDACFGSVPSPDSSPFDVLVRVTSSGRVEKILLRPKTNMSKCLVEAMNDDTFPMPPTLTTGGICTWSLRRGGRPARPYSKLSRSAYAVAFDFSCSAAALLAASRSRIARWLARVIG